MGVQSKLLGILLVLAGVASAAEPTQKMRIQFAEPLKLELSAGHAEFDAYGRRFAFELQTNERLQKSLSAASKVGSGPSRLFRGTLDGVAGSWVRLARVGDALEGAIWDGRDLYVVTRYAEISASLTTPLTVPGEQTVVYRLSDTLNGLPKGFCGIAQKLPQSKAGESALAQYVGMVAELRTQAIAIPSDQLDISLIADRSYQTLWGVATTDAMLARLNTVDGIFSQQVGVIIAAADLRLVSANNDPFTKTNPSQLLRQLSDYRVANPAVAAAGLAHLLTNKDLDGDVIGIAYLDALCDPRDGASLSDSELGEFYGALTMAHELGHNFGAEHDGETGSACASTPEFYVMAPQINGTSNFSQCSLNSMASPIARARGVCIGPASYAEVALDGNSPVQGDAGTPFTLLYNVRSVGTLPVTHVVFELPLRPEFSFVDGTVTGGTCGAVGSIVTCALGDIPANESRNLSLRLTSSQSTSATLQAHVTADKDKVASNNSANVDVFLRSAIDLGVAVQASAALFYVNDPIEITIDVSAYRTQPSRDATLSVGIATLNLESYSAPGHTCTYDPQVATFRCNLADIASGTTSRILLHTRSTQPWLGQISAHVEMTGDGDFNNNDAYARFESRAERELQFTVNPEDLRAVIGVPYTLTYTITSAGRLPANNASFVFNTLQTVGPTLTAITTSGGTCSPIATPPVTCNFGTLNPGNVRTVTATVRYDTAGQYPTAATTRWVENGNTRGDSVITSVYANLRVDAAVFSGGSPVVVTEGFTGYGSVSIASLGVDPAQNVVATLDLPAPARLTSIRIPQTPGWDCTILTPQRGECRGNFVSSTYLSVDYEFIADAAMTGDGTFSLVANADGDLSNNVSHPRVEVVPFVDVGVILTSAPTPLILVLGRVESVSFEVQTGDRPAPGVTANLSSGLPYYELVSIDAGGAPCTQNFDIMTCAIGDLPPHARVPITARYRGLRAGFGGYIGILVQAPSDYSNVNNSAGLGYTTFAATDAQLSLPQSSASGTAGAQFRLPLITVAAGAAEALNVVVDIPLPAFVTAAAISTTNAICSGTSTVSCTFSAVRAGEVGTIDILLNGNAAGTFTSNIVMRATNDSDAANNTATVAMTVAAASSGGGGGGASGGGSSGGGGRFEWLALVFLTLLAAKRLRFAGLQPRLMSRR